MTSPSSTATRNHQRPQIGQRENRAAGTAGRDQGQVRPYRRHGKPWHRSRLQNLDDYDIVRVYGAEYRGVVNYYLLAQDVWRLRALRWNAETSMLKTLAAKHQSTVTKMAARYKAKIMPATVCGRASRPGNTRRQAGPGSTIRRDTPAARPARGHTDPAPVPVPIPRKELIHRLRNGRCELCEQHHGGSPPGRQARPARETRTRPARVGRPHGQNTAQDARGLPTCHERIHATPSRTRHNRWRAQCLKARPLGSEGGCAEKARTHRERDLAAQPTLSTKPSPPPASTCTPT